MLPRTALGTILQSAFRGFTRYFSREASEVSLPWTSKLTGLTGAIGTGALATYFATLPAHASFGYAEDCLEPPKYPWNHNPLSASLDHHAIRRGYLVYRTIGAACHAMKFVHFRQLVDVAYTEKEMKEIAASYDDYLAEPNDEGEVLPRNGVLTDPIWRPYKNEKEARAANNGALPPDLSLIVRARDGGVDYIYSILTGYRDPPHGVKLAEGMYYNIYFPGCQISMPPPLAEGAVTYEEYPEIESSISQMAKDVSIYLTWSSFMEYDERHKMGIKTFAILGVLIPFFYYWKKWRWSYLKSRVFAPRSQL